MIFQAIYSFFEHDCKTSSSLCYIVILGTNQYSHLNFPKKRKNADNLKISGENSCLEINRQL